MNELQLLLDEFSKEWGKKYLMASPVGTEAELSTSRVHKFNSSSTQENDMLERTKVFPIRPKDDWRLVQIWFEHVLPVLSKILSPSLGGNYSASLVRRGFVGIRAEPCIQIESPRLPSSKARQIIKDFLNDIYKKNNCRWISIRFLKGSVRKLNGEKLEDHDDAEESAESQRYRFNLVRPYSRIVMGSSLGLKCSKKVLATLGGFVDIGGDKYMLTSEHFVTHSQEPANIDIVDTDDEDLKVLTSPSRYDLNRMKNDLKQTLRDRNSEISLLIRQHFGDREIPVDDVSDESLPLELRELGEKRREVINLLRQVQKPAHEYAIGSVFIRSTEPRTAAVPISVADQSRLKNKQLKALYHMDWSLCKLDATKAQVLENRHKYRSDQEAMADDYIEEKNRAKELGDGGDICHETCEVALGVSVYYVGQGSKHRSGTVTVPIFVSRDSSETIDWGIQSSDGQHLPYDDVAGDSGAWVIRQDGNKVMGQIHSYSSGQVLFTPIDIIFADIAKECGVKVDLPPRPPGSAQLATADPLIPLSAKPPTPPLRSLKFLKPSTTTLNRPQRITPTEQRLPPARASTPAAELLSQCKANTDMDQDHIPGSLDESASIVPSLTNTPQFSATTSESLGTPPPLDLSVLPDRQSKASWLCLERSLDDKVKSAASEIFVPPPNKGRHHQHLNQLNDLSRSKIQFRFRLTFGRRTPTWPVNRQRGIGKSPRQIAGYVQFPLSHTHSLPISAYSALDRFSHTSRKIGASDSL